VSNLRALACWDACPSKTTSVTAYLGSSSSGLERSGTPSGRLSWKDHAVLGLLALASLDSHAKDVMSGLTKLPVPSELLPTQSVRCAADIESGRAELGAVLDVPAPSCTSVARTTNA
jgi:hypothetical protein